MKTTTLTLNAATSSQGNSCFPNLGSPLSTDAIARYYPTNLLPDRQWIFTPHLESESCLSVERAIDFVNHQLVENDDRPLGIAEILLLKGIWDNKTYRTIALEENYSPDYFINVAAPKLLQKISKLLDRRITKKNCRLGLEKYVVGN